MVVSRWTAGLFGRVWNQDCGTPHSSERVAHYGSEECNLQCLRTRPVPEGSWVVMVWVIYRSGLCVQLGTVTGPYTKQVKNFFSTVVTFGELPSLIYIGYVWCKYWRRLNRNCALRMQDFRIISNGFDKKRQMILITNFNKILICYWQLNMP